MRRSRSMLVRLLAVGALLGLLVASISSIGAQSDDTAGLRIVHVGIDTPPVNVSVDGETVAENLFWLEATDYLDMAAGDLEISIFDPDTSLDDPLATATVTVEAGNNYSAVISGQLPTPEIVLIVDGDAGGVDAGMGAVRVFDSVPDTGAIDAVASDGTVIAENVDPMSASAYLMVAPGTYDIDFLEAGTENVLYSEAGVAITGGAFQTIYLSGFADPGNFAAETFIDEPGGSGGGGEPTATEAAPTATGDASATGTVTETVTATVTATVEPTATEVPPTATPEPTATPTAVPALPSTGAGGTADDGGTNIPLFGALALLLMAAGGGLLYWSRRTA